MVVPFLVVTDVCEELLRDLLLTQLVVHGDQQALGLGVDVAHLHAALVVEEHIVSLPRRVHAHVELLVLETRTHTRVITQPKDSVCSVYELI